MEPAYDQDGIKIYHGDCFITDAWLDADFLITDPPYGIGYNSGSRRDTLAASIQGDDDTRRRDRALHKWGDRPALIFGTWRVARPVGTQARLIWDTKGALGMGDLRIPWKPSDQEIYVLGGRHFTGPRTSNVLMCAPVQSTARNGRVHPHEKPVALFHMLLEKVPEDAVVADPFMGSGPLARACYDLGRRYIGVELERQYVDAAIDRLAQKVLF